MCSEALLGKCPFNTPEHPKPSHSLLATKTTTSSISYTREREQQASNHLSLRQRAPAKEWLQSGHPAPWALMVMLHKGHMECDKLMGVRAIRKPARQLPSQPWAFTSLLALPMATCMDPLPFSHPSLQGERVCWHLTDLQLLNSLL